MQSPFSLSEARAMDEADSLAPFRERFYLPPGQVYLDGNSLGLLSREAEAEVMRVVGEWRDLAIGGWLDASPAWFAMAEEAARLVAPLVGAEADAVIVTGSTTVNLHQLLATLYPPNSRPGAILADALAFPSDIYAIDSHLQQRGLDPATYRRLVPSRDGRTLRTEDILAAFTPEIAVAVLPSVIYTSGQLLDMPIITEAARTKDITILWDLSHSIGIVPHELHTIGADGAFWCHYKYLNAGPGAVGGLYLNRRHFGRTPGLAGWFGSDKARQFDMMHTFHPANGAGALQIGTPPLLSIAPLLGSLRLHHEAGIERIRTKSLALTGVIRAWLAANGLQEALPPALHQGTQAFPYGGHVALVHPAARAISAQLRANGVIPDFRPPDMVRLAPVPLYTSFADCYHALYILCEILERGDFSATDTGLVP